MFFLFFIIVKWLFKFVAWLDITFITVIEDQLWEYPLRAVFLNTCHHYGMTTWPCMCWWLFFPQGQLPGLCSLPDSTCVFWALSQAKNPVYNLNGSDTASTEAMTAQVQLVPQSCVLAPCTARLFMGNVDRKHSGQRLASVAVLNRLWIPEDCSCASCLIQILHFCD